MTYTLTPEETVWNEIKSRLEKATSLTYVKKIYEGDRMVNTNYETPCIFMDIDLADEEWVEFPRRRQNAMAIILRGAIDVRTRMDKQIVGDATQVGILHFENDIKKAFEGSDITLAGNVQDYKMETLSRKLIDNATREVTIRLTLKFKYFSVENRT